MDGIKSLNPHLNKRKSRQMISKIDTQLSNPVMLGLGIASTSANPIEPVINVGNGSDRMINGISTPVWSVRTTRGARFGVVNDNSARLLKTVESDPENLDTEDGAKEHADTTQFVAKEMASVPSNIIELARDTCRELHAAEGIGLLIGKLETPTTVDFVSIRSVGPNDDGDVGVTTAIVANNATVAYSAVIEKDRTRLLAEPSHEELAVISRAEIDDFCRLSKAS